MHSRTKPIVVAGAGGHARVVVDVLQALGWPIAAVVGEAEYPFPGLEVWPTDDDAIRRAVAGGLPFIVALGANALRRQVYDQYLSAGLEPVTAIHSTAYVAGGASCGSGTVVMPQAVVGADSRVGADSIVNTGAIVEHNCNIGDHADIGPGARLGGEVVVEEEAWVGMGAIVLQGLRIGAGALVGAGAVVTRDVAPGITVIGVPARPMEKG